MVDVLVIGAGPSGAVVTHTAAAGGLSVLCLEQGDWVNPSDFPANHPEWELLIQHSWHHDPNVRRLPSDYPLDVSESDMWPVMFNAVGGVEHLLRRQWPRLLPSDFRVADPRRGRRRLADLLRRPQALPRRGRRFIGVAGVDGDTAYPEGLDYPMPPHPLGQAPARRAAQAANDLGWHWWPGTNAIASQKHKTLEQCGRWGTCEWGCPAGRQGVLRPDLHAAGAAGRGRLITGARVRRDLTDDAGLAAGADWIDRDGAEHFQPARAVVLCANGIGTPRLLLLSASDRHPDGLANSSGLVGRNLMLHPNCTPSLGYYDDDLKAGAARPGS